ncbi:MAG TPA: hypothetical protein VIF57_18500 [Polyangia bacterium]|jgi:hypothetical protein
MRVVRRFRWLLLTFAALVLGPVTWAAAAPVHFDSREELFEIPKGTWARRMAGEKIEILPQEIRLVAGARDILVLRNRDDVPQIFGPTLMMPGQSFRLPFEGAAEYQFACTAHASGQMTVIVSDALTSPWARLRWRARKLLKRVKWLEQGG